MRITLLFLFLFLVSATNAQNKEYAKSTITKLASPEMHGRGYVNKGDRIAADFIASEFKRYNLQQFEKSYFQQLNFPINTIVEDKGIKIDNKNLIAGIEYMIDAAAKSCKGSFELVYLPDSYFTDKEKIKQFFRQDLTEKFILTEGRFSELKNMESLPAKGIIYLNTKKLIWSVSRADKVKNFVVIDIFDTLLSKNAKQIELNFKNKFYKKYKTQNVLGFVQGKTYPDSFLMITAHYDHLGRMGKNVYFPGANDNASGVAMMLDLASYFSKPGNEPSCSIIFMALCGEEAGLHGSFYAAGNPLFPLKNVRFLVNLDMVGTGSEGITIVNATIFKDAYDIFKKINDEKKYLEKVNAREESCNSDHCPFYKKGVPSVFIYSLGKEYQEYHNINDRAENIPLTDYDDIFRLMRDFLQTY